MLSSDLRSALRSISRQRAGSVLVLGMLTLAIAANVTVFALVNGLFLKPFPFPAPDRVVFINERAPKLDLEMTGINFPDFHRWREDQRLFEAIAAYSPMSVALAGDEGAERVPALQATHDLDDVLGLQPVLGRMFTAEEDRPGGAAVVVISHALWVERFSARPDAIGEALRVNSRPYTIVGVLPREASFIDQARLWLPLQGDPLTATRNYTHNGLGRMKPGVTIAQAEDDLTRAHQPIWDERDKERVVAPMVRDYRELLVSNVRSASAALSVAVALLLLIACANVASVMLARAIARRREMGIRMAIGATRVRLVRQLFAENLVLALTGGVLGLVFGQWLLRLLVRALGDQAPSWADFGLDAEVAVFAVVLSSIAAVVFGLAPAFHALKGDLHGAMSSVAGAATAAPRGRVTLQTLVGLEFALAAVLLVCAGLLFRAWERTQQVDPGFRMEHVAVFSLTLPGATYGNLPARQAFWDRALERLNAIPGMEAAGLVTCAPLAGCHWGRGLEVEGAPPRAEGDPDPVVLYRAADAAYARAMGLRLLGGRFLEPGDLRDGAPPVAVVNQTLARSFWPEGTPVAGKRIRVNAREPWSTVVGVVEDVKHYGLEKPMRPGLYVSYRSVGTNAMTFALRTMGEPSQVLPMAREAIRELDAELPVYRAKTMEQVVSESLRLRAVYSSLLAVFAGLALLLALGGAYGVMSYLVTQRTREVGIRMALGARGADVARSLVGNGALAVIAGIVAGLAAAVAISRWLTDLLFGVPPADPGILAAVSVALLFTATLATLVPVRHAARLDPMRALRTE